MAPKISITIPANTSNADLCRCLDNALACPFDEIEIILIKDNLCDSFVDILRDYEVKNPKIHIIEKASSDLNTSANRKQFESENQSNTHDHDIQTEKINRLTEELAITRLQLQNLCINRADRSLNPNPSIIDENDILLDLSIIIPVFNAANYIEECLHSIIEQDVKNYEIICVDDGSTDESPVILTKLAEIYPQIKVILQKNRGQGAARNVGLSLARGRYIQFADSDDKLVSNSIIQVLHRTIRDDLDVIYFDGVTFYDSEELAEQFKSFKTTYTRAVSHENCMTGIELFKQLKQESSYRVSPCLALFRREFLDENGIRFPEGVIYEDNAFMLKVICTANRVEHVNDPVYLRRIREGSTMTTSYSAKNVRSYYLVYLEMLQFSLNSKWDYETEKYVATELRSILNQIRSIYRKLDDTERTALCSLPPIRETMLDLILTQVSDQEKCEKSKRENEKLQKEIKRIKTSNSWKIGRRVTAPIRFLKRSVKRK